MSEKEIYILRLVISGINGLLFTLGVYLLLYNLKLKPGRMKKRLEKLADNSEHLDEANNNVNNDNSSLKQKEVERIKYEIENYFHNPRTILNIGFGGLIIAASLIALYNLLTITATPIL